MKTLFYLKTSGITLVDHPSRTSKAQTTVFSYFRKEQDLPYRHVRGDKKLLIEGEPHFGIASDIAMSADGQSQIVSLEAHGVNATEHSFLLEAHWEPVDPPQN